MDSLTERLSECPALALDPGRQPLVAPRDLPGGARLVAANVDGLVLSIQGALTADVRDKLQALRDAAAAGYQVDLQLADGMEPLQVSRFGRQPCYTVTAGLADVVDVAWSFGASLAATVTWRAWALWHYGAQVCADLTRAWGALWCEDGAVLVTRRLDVALDVARWRPPTLDGPWVARATDKGRDVEMPTMHADERWTGLQLTGLRFGVLSSNGVQVASYDKTREINVSGKAWQTRFWDGVQDGDTVFRVEPRARGKGLASVLADDGTSAADPTDLDRAARALVGYCLGSWLTLRTPTEDTNRARWPMDETWAALASLADTNATRAPLHHARPMPGDTLETAPAGPACDPDAVDACGQSGVELDNQAELESGASCPQQPVKVAPAHQLDLFSPAVGPPDPGRLCASRNYGRCARRPAGDLDPKVLALQAQASGVLATLAAMVGSIDSALFAAAGGIDLRKGAARIAARMRWQLTHWAQAMAAAYVPCVA